ncbi:hypothetical protein Ancab_007214 [Ancistrocladus abbreviatus]
MSEAASYNQTSTNDCLSTAPWAPNLLSEYPSTVLQLQMLLVYAVTQILHLVLFKPLGMPPLVSQLVAGILLGPSGLGNFKSIHERIFPPLSANIWKCIVMLSYSFTLFMVAVKMDFGILRRTGRKAYAIGLLSLAGTLSSSSLTQAFLQRSPMETKDLSFSANSLSLTSFPVIACLISDLGLFNSELGRLALSSAIASEILSISVVSFNNNFLPVLTGAKSLAEVSVNIVGMIILIIVVIHILRPFMRWMIKETPQGRPVKDLYAFIPFIFMLVGGLLSDRFGQFVLLGNFIVGAGVPDGPPLGSTLVEKFDMFITGILEPFFVSCCAMRTNIFAISFNSNITLTIVSIFMVVFATKISICYLCAVYNNMVFEDAMALAFILCHKGSIDIANYAWFRDFDNISEECFSVLALCVLCAATISSIAVRLLYNPLKKYAGFQRRNILHCKPTDDLRILTCIHRPYDVTTITNFLSVCSSTQESPIVAYVLHLIKLVGRSHPIFISHDVQKKKGTYCSYSEEILRTLNRFEHNNRDIISVHAYTAVSPPDAMHDDICTLALDKLVSLIILPYHRKFGFEGSIEFEYHERRLLNTSVLARAPCSVGILVDRGTYRHSNSNLSLISVLSSESLFSVGVIFIGGNDDREALAYAKRISRGNRISLTVIRFIAQNEEDALHPLDAHQLAEFEDMVEVNQQYTYIEEVTRDGAETALKLRSMIVHYNLLIVGRRFDLDCPQTSGLKEWSEIRELGILGDLLSSPELRCETSVLIMQQQQQWIR